MIPVVTLVVVEVALRLGGYGYSTEFFKPFERGGEKFLVENDKFGWRFFPPEVARAPAPVIFPARKAKGTFRVFVLGESAALGDPRPAYGFSRYLEVLLNERYPNVKFEVINVGMTAMNSHGIREIAQECTGLEGDAWIVYMGNNEFYGPFGAGTVFGPQAPRIGLVRARLVLQSTRLGQLLAAGAMRLRGGQGTVTNWGGLRMFLGQEIPPDDPRRAIVYANFARNLDAIVTAGVKAGATILVSSMAVNLRDCGPFASVHGSVLTGSARDEWERRFRESAAAQEAGDFERAMAGFSEVAKLSPGHAEAQFRLAELELRMTNALPVGNRFSLARDLDALPFRADSRLNEIARSAAERFGPRGAVWLDAATELGRSSAGGVPGGETLYEHVHLNFDGNYRLARLAAEQLTPRIGKLNAGAPVVDWASQEKCERLLGLTDWNRGPVYETMMGRLLEPPYTNQAHAAARLLELGARVKEARERQTPSARLEAQAQYESAIRQRPADHRLHENFAEFLEATGDSVAAAREWQAVCDLIPQHLSGWYQSGRLLAATQRYAAARTALDHALQLRPDLVEAQVELAGVDVGEGKLDDALARCDQAIRQRPAEPLLHVRRADILARLKRRPEAIASLIEAKRVRPSHWEARYLLGVELAMEGKIAEAEVEFAEAVRLRPEHIMSRVNLGTALARQLRMDEAEAQFSEVLRLDPLNQRALQAIETIKVLRGR